MPTPDEIADALIYDDDVTPADPETVLPDAPTTGAQDE